MWECAVNVECAALLWQHVRANMSGIVDLSLAAQTKLHCVLQIKHVYQSASQIVSKGNGDSSVSPRNVHRGLL
jgi:hypothetical protein